MEARVATGKVKKLARALFMALTKSYLLPAFVKNAHLKAEAPKSRSGAQPKFTKSHQPRGNAQALDQSTIRYPWHPEFCDFCEYLHGRN